MAKGYTGRHREGTTGHVGTKREGGSSAGSSGGKAILSDTSGSFAVDKGKPDDYRRS